MALTQLPGTMLSTVNTLSSAASTNLTLQTNAGGTTVLTADTNGNLGLGVTPSAWNIGNTAMQVGAVAALNGTSSSMQLATNFYQDASGSKYIANGYSNLYMQSSGTHVWYNAPVGTAGSAISFTQAMTLDASGNLGIGTSSPNSAGFGKGVEVYSAAASAASIVTGGSNSYSWVVSSDTNAFRAFKGTTELMRLDSSGNLGLGIPPSAWYSSYKAMQLGSGAAIQGSTNVSRMAVSANWYADSAGNDKYIGTGYASVYTQLSGAHTWYTAPSGTAGNAITFTQAMTLDASGNLGVGTTVISGFYGSSSVATRGVYVYSSSSTNCDTAPKGLVIRNDDTTAGNLSQLVFGSLNTANTPVATASIWSVNDARSSGFSTGSLAFGTVGGSGVISERARIDSSGNLGLGVTPSAWNTGKVMQIGSGAADLALLCNNNDANISSNAYYNSGWKYQWSTSVAASKYQQTNGTHVFYNAVAGTAGSAISFTQAMTLDASGNLLVGTTTSPVANGSTTTKTLLVNNTILTGPIAISTSGPFGITTSTSGTVNYNATLSLNLWYFNGSSNQGAVAGHLYVNIVNASQYQYGNMDVWAVTAKGATIASTFTKIQGTTGTIAGTGYSLTWNSSGQIVLTNQFSGFSYCFVAMSFVGVTGILE